MYFWILHKNRINVHFNKKKIEDSKRVIRGRKSKMNRQHNENSQKNKQRSINLKIDQRQPLKNRGEFMCSGRVNRCCSISGTRRVTHCYKEVQVMNEERAWLQTEHIRGHLWHRYSVMVNQVMVATLKLMTNLTTVNPWFSSFPVSSNPLWYI